MDENPYLAPKVYGESVEESHSRPNFYVVSPAKFYGLFLLTLGLYGFYWNYRNWKLYNDNYQLGIRPVLRAVFSVFFTFALCRAVEDVNETKQPKLRWHPNWIATLSVLSALVPALMMLFTTNRLQFPPPNWSGWIGLPFEVFFASRIQRAINHTCGDPTGSSNRYFSAANILWVLLILALFVVGSLGIVLPTTP